MSDEIDTSNGHIQKLLLQSLKSDWIGKTYRGRIVVDIQLEICEREYTTDWGGGSFTELNLSVLTETKSGRSKKWEIIYF